MKTLTIRNKKTAAIRRFHPWVFSGAIKSDIGHIEDGELVRLQDEGEQFLATGHYQKGSISVRILSFTEGIIDQAFWNAKLQAAFAYRKHLGLTGQPETNCYRLVHGEGDGLPGLIIDIYAATAVIQCHSIGMYQSREMITQALQEVYGDQLAAVYNKSSNTLPSLFAMGVEDEYLHGKKESEVVFEYGHQFIANWEDGQKTGFFLDQRENRAYLAKGHCRDKTVLNAFCYTGGFSIFALGAGAKWVDSVDISARAIELTEENVALNQFDSALHQSHRSDVMAFLQDCPQYDLVVIDPPAYAKNIKKRHNAVQGYKRLNARALGKVKSGGMLATFSCSQVIDQQLFNNTVVAGALEAGRQVRVVRQFQQGPDHPVNAFHPEGAYLKGLLLYVT